MRNAWLVVVLALAGCVNDVPHPFPNLPGPAATLPAAILWSDPFPALFVEIDYVEGREPSEFALSAFRDTLESVTGKTEVVIQPPTPLPSTDARFEGNRAWNASELAEVHATYFDARAAEGFGEDGVARLHVLYLNGYYPLVSQFHVPEVTEAIGMQMSDALLLFLDDVPASDRPWISYYERNTIVHELGHAMGLVNLGLPMQRPHVSEDGKHSNNARSVMAQGHRGPFVLEKVQDGEWIPYRFDADDLADIAAFQAQQSLPSSR